MRISTRLDTNATPFFRTVKVEFPISCIQAQTRREPCIPSALDGVGHCAGTMPMILSSLSWPTTLLAICHST